MSAEALELAVAIGDRLCRDAVWDQDRAVWLGDEKVPIDAAWEVVLQSVGGDLYGGTSGIALFLARLWSRTSRDEFRRTARGALGHAGVWARQGRRDGSLYSGLAGVAAATAEAADRFEDEVLRAEACRLTNETLLCLPAPETDLIAGTAGTCLALLELGRRLAMPAATETAFRMGRGLLEQAVRDPYPGLSWDSDDATVPPLCGLGHGASGVGFVLGELWLAGGGAWFLDGSKRAAEYERAWFQRERCNWPDLREVSRQRIRDAEGVPFPAFWCHGAIGIGLARLRQYELTGQRILAAETEAALEAAERSLTMFEDGGGATDLSLCHGLAAHAELFVSAARVFADARYQSLAEKCVRLAASIANGGAGPWPSGVPEGGENPSLMLGVAGTGMMFLRVADPDTAPVGLLFTNPVTHVRVIVQLKPEVPVSEYAQAAQYLVGLVEGGRVERISARGRVLLRLPLGITADKVVSKLEALHNVEYAEPDQIDHEATQ